MWIHDISQSIMVNYVILLIVSNNFFVCLLIFSFLFNSWLNTVTFLYCMFWSAVFFYCNSPRLIGRKQSRLNLRNNTDPMPSSTLPSSQLDQPVQVSRELSRVEFEFNQNQTGSSWFGGFDILHVKFCQGVLVRPGW